MADTIYLPLWDKNFIDTSPIADLTATIKAGTIYQTIEFHNTSRYQLLITLQPVGGQPKVIIPAWSTKQFISPGSTLYVSVDTSYPADTNVSTTLLSAEKIYALLKTGIEAPYVLPLSVQTSSIITSGAVNATITGTTDVNVTNIPTITIDSSGNTVNVGNTIDANVTGAVTANLPAGSSIEVTQAVGDALNIGNVQSIVDNVQSQVVNDYVTNNPFVTSTTQTMPSATIPAGGNVGYMMHVPTGVYDAATLYAYYNNSPNGLSGITFQCNQIRYQVGSEDSTFVGFDQNWSFPYYNDNANKNNVSALLPFNGEYLCNYIYIYMTNTNTVSVTINFQFTLFLRYASQQISNTTSAPAISQASVGTFDTPVYFSQDISFSTTSVTNNITTAGDYVRYIKISGSNAVSSYGVNVNVFNGSQEIYTFYLAASQESFVDFIPLGTGVYDNGISVTIVGNGGSGTLKLDLIAIKNGSAGAAIPNTIQ